MARVLISNELHIQEDELKIRSLSEISEHREWRENHEGQNGNQINISTLNAYRQIFSNRILSPEEAPESEQSKTTFGNSRIWNVYHLLYQKGLSEAIVQENEKWIQKEDRESK